MTEKTNYILHLNRAFGMFCDDDRLSPYHISLYFSLFQYWNLAKFRNPISISRDEIMRACRIGSVNTYIRCMKEMHEWKYFQYLPSYNPLKGSKVHMFNFDNANNKTKNNDTAISADNSFKKTTKKAPAKTNETQLRPSINNTNKKNKTNHENTTPPKRRKNDLKNSSKPVKQKRKSGQTSSARAAHPGLRQIENHFRRKNFPIVEAQKFFNYYQSNGWMVGKSPMKNWQAAADNWMLKSEQFSTTKGKVKDRIHVSKDKNYAEPL